MGIIKFRSDPNAQKNEREEREKLAEESNNATETVEFSSIKSNMKKLRDAERAEELKRNGLGIDGPIEVCFGAGFNDPRSYSSLEQLEAEEEKKANLSEGERYFNQLVG